MAKYRKKPVVVEAVQWTGENRDEIDDFLGKAVYREFCDHETLRLGKAGGTLTAVMAGEWIIRSMKGTHSVESNETFEAMYEPVEEDCVKQRIVEHEFSFQPMPRLVEE